MIDGLAETTLTALLEQTASSAPVPGAGPASATTCALAAALVEMVSRVSLTKDPGDPAGIAARAARAAELRDLAVTLAERDMEAYAAVLAAARTRGEPGHAGALSEALSAAADPPAAILETASEVTRLAAEAFADADGAVRGEAVTAAILAEACARACVRIIALNLGGRRDDPRLDRARELAAAASAELARVER